MNASDVRALIHERWPRDRGWLAMDEVTPPGTSNRLDVIAIGMWRSNAHEVHGFEVKVARADWQREAANPAKAEPLMRWCDRYWLVCPPDVAGVGEVPATWGVLHATENGLRQKRAAPRLPRAGDRGADFWCTMLLRLMHREKPPDAELRKAEHEGWQRGFEEGKRHAAYDVDNWKRAHERLRGEVQAFEEASGVSIASGWKHGAEVGQALGALLATPLDRLIDRVADHSKQARAAAEALASIETALRTLLPAPPSEVSAP